MSIVEALGERIDKAANIVGDFIENTIFRGRGTYPLPELRRHTEGRRESWVQALGETIDRLANKVGNAIFRDGDDPLYKKPRPPEERRERHKAPTKPPRGAPPGKGQTM